jgi:hypothetical protein
MGMLKTLQVEVGKTIFVSRESIFSQNNYNYFENLSGKLKQYLD